MRHCEFALSKMPAAFDLPGADRRARAIDEDLGDRLESLHIRHGTGNLCVWLSPQAVYRKLCQSI